MADFTVSVVIHAAADTVWDVLTDVAGMADIIPAITRIDLLTDGPFRVGSRWKETRLMGSRKAAVTFQVAALDPKRSYTVIAVAAGTEYRCAFTLTPQADATRLDLRTISRPVSPAGRVMLLLSPVMVRSMKRMTQQDLDLVKSHIESAAG